MFNYYIYKTMYLGVHLFTNKGLLQAIKEAEVMDINAIQLFIHSPASWKVSSIPNQISLQFKEAILKAKIKFVFAHSSYLINLASPKEQVYKNSIICLKKELNLCKQLGIPFLVVHTGSPLNKGEKYGIEKIIKSLKKIDEEGYLEKTGILLENTAGAGNTLGWKLEQLAEILKALPQKEKIGICLDTCHLLASGYNISNSKGLRKTLKSFSQLIGMERLKLLHLNDSFYPCNSRRDKHQHIGKGYIGRKGFSNIVNEPKLKHLPMILETPKGVNYNYDKENLSVLRSLIKDEQNLKHLN